MTYAEIERIVVTELSLLLIDAGHAVTGRCVVLQPTATGLILGPDTPLLAEGAPIDSFDLVNLVVAIEERLEREGHTIEILDEHATTGLDSPFRTVASLARHVHGKVG